MLSPPRLLSPRCHVSSVFLVIALGPILIRSSNAMGSSALSLYILLILKQLNIEANDFVGDLAKKAISELSTTPSPNFSGWIAHLKTSLLHPPTNSLMFRPTSSHDHQNPYSVDFVRDLTSLRAKMLL